MYVRLLQGYDAMDADSQKACSYAARQLRLMVITHLYDPHVAIFTKDNVGD